MHTETQKQIVIVGGGFGGIRCALDLAKRRIPNAAITLISDKPYFEYHPALYRVATGRSEKEACVQIAEILKGKPIRFIEDRIREINISQKQVAGSSGKGYPFDYLVLALGSETAYFHIPGLKEFCFGFKSIADALRLKNHIHEMFTKCAARQDDEEEDVCRLHFVIVGGGATGVELAGELAHYARAQAIQHTIDPSFITIDLIEASSRILPMFPAEVSERVANRLRMLGVNIFCNRQMTEAEVGELKVRGMTLKTETVIWTAGVKPHSLYQQVEGFSFDQRGRVLVDEHLRAKGLKNVFVIGDGASTPYCGFAQTAILEGKLAAQNIERTVRDKSLKRYSPKKPAVILPLGFYWGVVLVGPLALYGFPAWILRRLADFRYFLSLLPLGRVIKIFFSKRDLCKSCGICQ